MTATENPALESDRVRRATPAELLHEIEAQIEHSIRFYSVQTPEAIGERINELKQEWSLERYLQLKVSTFGLLTAIMSLTSNRKWAVLTCGVLGYFLYHATRGGSSSEVPLVFLRRLGVRTRSEIDRELYALKAIRGDFEIVPIPQPHTITASAVEVLRAVNA